ncbi:FAD-binding oxidoreductase [Symbioplanes lichenis]|uniref:FAD-binding oxidoreductase n=1 Tax=Symbioplanes lichenis TaxID=1629072 RepID=UPI002739325A|nr:FAD-binding oxidoreductase [Actinoplanes lichenis]
MDSTRPGLPAREPLLRALIDICGPDFARPARASDHVAGRLASFVAAPATTRAVVRVMGLAAERGLAVFPRGSGSKLDWGVPPRGVDLLLDTGRLDGIWHHDVAAATAEIGAGTPLKAVRAALALRGQRLAVDPPSPTATLGGMLARNESGPLRYRFGTPAAQIVAVSYVTRDGDQAESDGEEGRPGIAEIDGVLLSATVRLQPLPEARRWVTVPVPAARDVPALVGEVQALGVRPSAIELDLPTPVSRPPGTLAVLIEGDAAGATQRAEQVAKALGDGSAVAPTAPAWWGRYPFHEGDIALRVTAPLEALQAAVYALSDATGIPVPVRGGVVRSVLHAMLPGTMTPRRVEGVLDAVRGVLLARDGRCVALYAPPAVSSQIDMARVEDLF